MNKPTCGDCVYWDTVGMEAGDGQCRQVGVSCGEACTSHTMFCPMHHLFDRWIQFKRDKHAAEQACSYSFDASKARGELYELVKVEPEIDPSPYADIRG